MPTDNEFDEFAPDNEFDEFAPAQPAPSMKVEPKSIRGTGAPDDELGIQRGAEVASSKGFPRGVPVNTVGEGKNSTSDVQLQDRATANNPLSGDPLARTIVAGILGHGAGTAASGIASALGAGSTAAATAGGAAGGATASGTQGGSPIKGAIAGGLLSGLMSFAGNRAAESLTRAGNQATRAANPAEREALLAQNKEALGKAMVKYKLGNLKNPAVAKEATDVGIQKAQQELEAATDAVRQAPVGGPLYNSALARTREIEQELNALKAIRPVVTRLATDHEMRMTMVEQLAREPVTAAKNVANAAISAPIRAVGQALRPADIALAKLYQLKVGGQPITPEVIAAAVGAGVDPNVAKRFAGQQ